MAWNCTIKMTREAGISLLVEDEEQQRSTQLDLLGERVVITVKDQRGTSVVTQEPTLVKVTCQEVQVEAKTITLSAEQSLDLRSQRSATLHADSDLAATAANVKVSADSGLSLAGAQIGAEAQATLKLASAGQAKLGGLEVAVQSDGLLNVSAQGIATLKGAMVNVSGNLINLG